MSLSYLGFTAVLTSVPGWSAPQLEISVITDDRPKSLARLLSSLGAAHFFGDCVSLRINVEQTAGPETLQLIDNFHWPHGPVFVHRRVTTEGCSRPWSSRGTLGQMTRTA